MKQTLSILLFGLLLVACDSSNSNASSDNAPINVNQDELLLLVNEARSTSRMCGDTSYAPTSNLRWSGLIAIVAQNHSDDMNKNNFLGHTSSDGKTLQERLNQVGYSSTNHIGENLAQGYPTEQSVMEEWLKSPEHCANIMNPNYSFMGTATAGAYWTQVFTD